MLNYIICPYSLGLLLIKSDDILEQTNSSKGIYTLQNIQWDRIHSFELHLTLNVLN
jgi:hypothetical protein